MDVRAGATSVTGIRPQRSWTVTPLEILVAEPGFPHTARGLLVEAAGFVGRIANVHADGSAMVLDLRSGVSHEVPWLSAEHLCRLPVPCRTSQLVVETTGEESAEASEGIGLADDAHGCPFVECDALPVDPRRGVALDYPQHTPPEVEESELFFEGRERHLRAVGQSIDLSYLLGAADD